MSRIGIVGAGAWGRALAVLFGRAGQEVWLWGRDPARAGLPEGARRAAEPSIPAAEVLLLAVPVQHFREVVRRIAPGSRPLVSVAKGMEAATGLMPLEILAAVHPGAATAVLTGPTFAGEIAKGLPAAAVVAAADAGLRRRLRSMLSAPGFRLYGNADPVGAQVGGAAKNVIAIAAGAVSGAGLGENARAGLVTRGLAELSRLVIALGGRRETSFGLSGLGDLVLTCTGRASRNFRYGLALGQGETPVLEGVAEGVATAPALVARAERAGCEVPIAAEVARLLAGEATLKEAMEALLARPQKDE